MKHTNKSNLLIGVVMALIIWVLTGILSQFLEIPTFSLLWWCVLVAIALCFAVIYTLMLRKEFRK